MTKLKYLYWLLPLLLASGGNVVAADQTDGPEVELLEFLGAMDDELDDWELFIELADEELPPVLAEVEHDK